MVPNLSAPCLPVRTNAAGALLTAASRDYTQKADKTVKEKELIKQIITV